MSDQARGLRPVRVFVSYSHKDESLVHELENHLSVLRRAGVIADWSNRRIAMGADWHREISTALEAADLILLLLSPTATLLEHALLAQGFVEVQEAAFPRCLPPQNRDSTCANLVEVLK